MASRTREMGTHAFGRELRVPRKQRIDDRDMSLHIRVYRYWLRAHNVPFVCEQIAERIEHLCEDRVRGDRGELAMKGCIRGGEAQLIEHALRSVDR